MRSPTMVRDADLSIIRQILSTGAVKVVGANSPRTFYVRFRTMLKEKGIGRFIRSSMKDDGIWFWLYPKFPTLTLTQPIMDSGIVMQYSNSLMSAGGCDKAIDAIKVAMGLQEEPGWVTRVHDAKLPTTFTKFFIGKVYSAMKGDDTVDEIIDFISGGAFTQEQKEILVKAVEEALG